MEKYNVNKGIDRKTLEDAIEHIFREDKKEVRRFQGFRGCIVYGAISLGNMITCDNPECSSCEMMKKSWDKVVKEYLNENKEKDMLSVPNRTVHILKGKVQDMLGKTTKAPTESSDKEEGLCDSQTDTEE